MARIMKVSSRAKTGGKRRKRPRTIVSIESERWAGLKGKMTVLDREKAIAQVTASMQ